MLIRLRLVSPMPLSRLLCIANAVTDLEAIRAGDDLVGGFGPDERFGIVAVLVDGAVDGLEVEDRLQAAALDMQPAHRLRGSPLQLQIA
jgi:hypothetical protein